MNTIMDIDTDGAIRVACGRRDYKTISRLAMSAVDGLCSMEFHDCFGRADYPAVREYAEKLLESGELKYELAEHCVADGIKHSTEGPHYIFSYSVLCKGFDGGDAWHAGISPAIYTKASCLLSDGDLPSDVGFDAPDRCRLLPLYSVGARPSRRGGAEVSFDIPVSAFASVLSGERYMELLHAVHRYNVQPQLHCLCLLFNTDGIKKLCRMCVENIMKGYTKSGEVEALSSHTEPPAEEPCNEHTCMNHAGEAKECLDHIELHSNDGSVTTLHGARLKEGPIQVTCSGSAEVSNEAQFCVPAAEPANVVPVTHGIDGEARRYTRATTTWLPEKR